MGNSDLPYKKPKNAAELTWDSFKQEKEQLLKDYIERIYAGDFALAGCRRRADLSFNPTNIVAITFTRKAADEIKGRVRQAVSECVEQAQNDLERLRWQEHLQKVESAPISTIHSLCSRILRDNPVETQLDPEFTILEDFEAQYFFKETLQQYLRKNIKENAALRRLVQTYGVNSFVNQVTALGDKLSELVREDNLAEPYLKAKED